MGRLEAVDTPRGKADEGPRQGPGDVGRRETQEERADRRWAELIQEVRVAQTGVQILFGFLLTVVFTERFDELGDIDRAIYVVTVVLGSTTTGALIAPVSFHRLVTGRRIKPQAVVWASRLTLVGLVLLLCTLTAALLLVLRVATHNAVVPYLVAGVVGWYLLCWFVLPAWARHRHTTPDRDGRQ
ncbi:Amine oxidase OS=Streptomyces alboniger OX=132473 GN=CP975_31615 PE=4 SV=1 [Streptomyces alboniger]